MKTNRIFAAMVIAFCTVLASCMHEITPVDGHSESCDVKKLRFTMVTPSSNSILSTKAMSDSEIRETRIEDLAFFFFREDNTSRKADYVFSTDGDFSLSEAKEVSVGGQTTYRYDISFECSGISTGTRWYVYAIANWNKSFFNVSLDQLRDMTRSQMDEFCILKTSDTIIPTDTALLLTGRAGESGGRADNGGVISLSADSEGMSDIGTIHLRRFVSKITLRIQGNADRAVSFTPKTMTVYNYSRSATLFERSGWATASGTMDYDHGTFPGDLAYLGVPGDAAFSNPSNGGIGYDMSKGEFTFYMCENVQSPKNSFSDYNLRDKRSDDHMSFVNAPDRGTYVVVTGDYVGPAVVLNADTQSVSSDLVNTGEHVSGTVSYTIHLGNFSTRDPLVAGSADNFTIRRNSKYIYNVTVNGVNNIIVEAEYGNELQSGAEGELLTTKSGTTNLTVDAHYEQVLIRIPDEAGFDSYSFALNTPYSGGKQMVSEYIPDLDVAWVKFAKPVSDTGIKTFQDAVASGLTDIYGLLEDLKAQSGQYYLTVDGSRYVAAYVDEYFYEDETDLIRFINAPDRELTLATSVSTSPDGMSSFTQTPIFSIRQRSIKTPYDIAALPAGFIPFGVELYEETAAAAFGDSMNSSLNYGWSNSVSRLSTDGTSDWSSYVNETANVHVGNSLPVAPMVIDKGHYQCLSRNRDLNGDGKIDAEEVRWYLPAKEQANILWYGASLLTAAEMFDNNKTYWSSTYSNRTWWALEGTAFNANDNFPSLVRCVRTLIPDDSSASIKSYTAETTQVFNHTGSSVEDGISIQVAGLNTNDQLIVRDVNTSYQIGEYDSHYTNDGVNDKLPSRFRIAKDWLTTPVLDVHVSGQEETIYEDFSFAGEKSHEEVGYAAEDVIYARIDVSGETSANAANILSIGSAIDVYRNAAHNNVHFYYTPSTRVLLIDVTNTSRTQYSYTLPADNDFIDIVYTVDAVYVGNICASHPEYTASTIQIGSEEGSGRSTSMIVAVMKNPEALPDFGTRDSFSMEEITSGSLCQNYYSEEGDPGKGVWRVPNEKEFAMMFSLQQNYGISVLKSHSAARTTFDRLSDFYSDSGDSIFWLTPNQTITTSKNDKPSIFYVRCIRDER